MANPFKFTIEGRNVTPQSVRVEDLIEVIRKLKSAIYAASVDSGEDRSTLKLSLVGVDGGSDILSFVGSPSTKYGMNRITASIIRGDISDLPERSQRDIKDLWQKAKNRDWKFVLVNGTTATIDPEREFQKPLYRQGKSSLLAKIERAGGTASPSVIVYLPNGKRKRLKIRSTDIAQQIGGLLYKTVELIGDAKWSALSGELVSFFVTDVGTYVRQNSNPLAAIENIKQINPEAWAGIDPDEYLNQVRGDDSD